MHQQHTINAEELGTLYRRRDDLRALLPCPAEMAPVLSSARIRRDIRILDRQINRAQAAVDQAQIDMLRQQIYLEPFNGTSQDNQIQ
jgi:hypothetical protein